MKFCLAACFLQSSYFGHGLSNLFFLQSIDCVFQILYLEINIVQFFLQKLIATQIKGLLCVIFFISKTVNCLFFLQLVAYPVL